MNRRPVEVEVWAEEGLVALTRDRAGAPPECLVLSPSETLEVADKLRRAARRLERARSRTRKGRERFQNGRYCDPTE